MKAWFDILTPKQVLFFGPVIDDLREKGWDVLVTSRRYREVEPMARLAGLEMKFVGERGEKGRMQQLLAATQRQAELIPIVDAFGPAVAVSLASGVCARVAYGMGISHVAVNDSPHSEAAGRLSLPLSKRLACPWIIPYTAWSRFGVTRSQITRYRALDPAVWLKREPLNGPAPKLSPERKTIVVRVEESDAPYMARSDNKWVDKVLSGLAEKFPDCNLVALTRYSHQFEEVFKAHGSNFVVPRDVVDGRRLLEKSDLFIGMGGTMTAEAALLGVPAISAFQGSYLIEGYLASKGLLYKTRDEKSLLRAAERMLDQPFKKNFATKSEKLLAWMEDPVPRITSLIVKTAEQG